MSDRWLITFTGQEIARRAGGAMHELNRIERTFISEKNPVDWLVEQRFMALKVRQGDDGEAIDKIIIRFACSGATS